MIEMAAPGRLRVAKWLTLSCSQTECCLSTPHKHTHKQAPAPPAKLPLASGVDYAILGNSRSQKCHTPPPGSGSFMACVPQGSLSTLIVQQAAAHSTHSGTQRKVGDRKGRVLKGGSVGVNWFPPVSYSRYNRIKRSHGNVQ